MNGVSGGDLLENVDQTGSQSASKKMAIEGHELSSGLSLLHVVCRFFGFVIFVFKDVTMMLYVS